MTTPVISLRGVSRKFRRVRALQDIDLDVFPAEITGIIGPDGSGKSTLLKICSGILSFEGRAVFMGADLRKDAESIKRHLSFMPQGIGQNLYMDLSVEENIDFFAALKDVPAGKRDSLKQRLLDATGLQPFRQRRARHLSGGMKQKLGICCSLVSEPNVLLLDEPSTGIDPLSRRQMWELLHGFVSGTRTTIVLGTSYMDEAERCHSLYFLDEGSIVFSGPPEQLMKDDKALEEAFFEILLGRKGETPAPDIPFRPEIPGGDTAAVRIKGVSKSFDSFKALDGIDISIGQGEVFGLLGPNGAGKTTLIKCMTGLLRPDKGVIRVSGLDPESPELKSRIGYMSQVFSLYGDLTVRENIGIYGALYGIRGEALRERMDWIIDASGLRGREGTVVKDLPLGIKQRLALGCATLNLPSILFLDEPTSGVDPVVRRSFWRFIRGLSDNLGITVIVTTHNLVEADFCDRIAIMNEARVIALDTPGELRRVFVEEQGDVYELYPEDDVDTDIFASHRISVTSFGRRYHVWRKGLSEGDVRSLLDTHGIRYRYLRRIRPPRMSSSTS
ncbi:MAG: ABC transporter ATP-binding protein [Nitrospirae bacterium]|nr:ABC transporter ATP-binding protein [Nitrospirota bacterium]